MTREEADAVDRMAIKEYLYNLNMGIKVTTADDVLNKIKDEIEALPKTYPFVNHLDIYVKEDDVLAIIDKYMAKESDKNE